MIGPAYLPVLPHAATAALAALAVTHPIGVRNLALVIGATFLARK